MNERKMVAGDIGMSPMDILARRIVDGIFTDLRDRKFLEYVFAEEPDNRAGYGHVSEQTNPTTMIGAIRHRSSQKASLVIPIAG